MTKGEQSKRAGTVRPAVASSSRKRSAGVKATVWHDPTFRLYAAARAVAVIGNSITVTALPVAAYQTSGTATAVAVVAAGTYVPYLLIGFIAGVIADRHSRQMLMVMSSVVAGASIGSVPLAYALGVVTLPHLAVAGALSASSLVVFDAANLSALPSLFPGPRLAQASGIVWSLITMGDIVGPLLAGMMLSLVMAPVVLAMEAVTFAAAAFLIWRISGAFEDASRRTGRPPFSAVALVTEVREGIAFLLRDGVLRASTFAAMGMTTTGGAVFGLLAVYAARVLQSGDDGREVGLLNAAVGIGSLAAALLLSRLVRWFGEGRLLLGGLVVNGAAALGLALVDSLSPSMAVMTAYGGSFALVSMTTVLVRQQLTPDELRGRVVITGRVIASSAGRSIGVVCGGVLAAQLSTQTTYLVMTVGVGAAMLLCQVSGLSRLNLHRSSIRAFASS